MTTTHSTSSHNTARRHFAGHIVDIEHQEIYDGEIIVADGTIEAIRRLEQVADDAPYLMPGFTDAHIHIESSMMTPVNFARVAVRHGVVNAVCDPHEITNVLGVEGIDFMIGNARNSRFNFCFGLPSCVPSSHLETAGATIDATQTRTLIGRDDLHFLAEMMNYPGVLFHDQEVMAKIDAARQAGKPVDGHAPGVSGEELKRYAAAGISTDHECSSLEEARERIACGMKVIVREGSAARNFEALYPIIGEAPKEVMLCSDDKHPDDLLRGHIDELVRRGVEKGLAVWNLLQSACLTPVAHYGLQSGVMRTGDKATFIAVDNLHDFNIRATVIEGHEVYTAEGGVCNSLLTRAEVTDTTCPNNFKASPITEAEIATTFTDGKVKVIVAFDGELYTRCEELPARELEGEEIQKIMVYNRYGNGRPQTGFIRGFHLSHGAIGATIAHDSHNIVAIGATDRDIVSVVNALIAAHGGVGVSSQGHAEVLPLPIAGLMSEECAEEIARRYARLDAQAKALGCRMKSPFITMAFMALPVIPELKITDKGLVDVRKFDFTDLVTR